MIQYNIVVKLWPDEKNNYQEEEEICDEFECTLAAYIERMMPNISNYFLP